MLWAIHRSIINDVLGNFRFISQKKKCNSAYRSTSLSLICEKIENTGAKLIRKFVLNPSKILH